MILIGPSKRNGGVSNNRGTCSGLYLTVTHPADIPQFKAFISVQLIKHRLLYCSVAQQSVFTTLNSLKHSFEFLETLPFLFCNISEGNTFLTVATVHCLDMF